MVTPHHFANVRLLLGPAGMPGYFWQSRDFATFTYLPKLALLWTGLALLMGAFVQLLWEERQITSM